MSAAAVGLVVTLKAIALHLLQMSFILSCYTEQDNGVGVGGSHLGRSLQCKA